MTTSLGIQIAFKANADKVKNAFRDTAKAARGTEQAVRGADNAVVGLTYAATKMFAVFGGFAAVIRFASGAEQTFRGFSAALSDLSAITGATGNDLLFLSNAAKEFGRTTLTGATEALEGFKLVASAKPDLLENKEALKAVTKEVITLSEASGIQLADAAKAIGLSLNQFDADANQAARFVNVLAAGAKFGASEVSDTSRAIEKSGTVAKMAGISFEELNSAIQILAANGIKGELAGTALKTALLKLQSQADSSINPAVVGLSTALENLAAKQLSATEMSKLFGLEAVVAGNILVSSAGKLDVFTKKLTGTNTALEQATIKTESYAGKVTKLQNAWEGFNTAFGESAFTGNIIDEASFRLNRAAENIQKSGAIIGSLESFVLDPIIEGTETLIVKPVTNAVNSVLVKPVQNLGDKLDRLINKQQASPILESQIPAINFNLAGAQNLLDFGLPIKQAVSTVQESFIPSIRSAGTELLKFVETATQANTRLANAFDQSGFSNPIKDAAKAIIATFGAQNKPWLMGESVDSVANSDFMQQVNETALLVHQAKFAKGENRTQLLQKIDSMQEALNNEAFLTKGVSSPLGVGFSSGGTFSATGIGSSGAELQLKQSIVEELNKFLSQQLDTNKQMSVTVKLDLSPTKDFNAKIVGSPENVAQIEKVIEDISGAAASMGAR